MKVINEYPSIVEMDKIYFEKLEFRREENVLSDKLNARFEKSIEKSADEEDKYRVSLQCTIEDLENNALYVFASMIGIFHCKASDPTLLNTLVNENTVAIMFPFLRSQVSLITAQPEMSPIILPSMNINSLVNDIDSHKK